MGMRPRTGCAWWVSNVIPATAHRLWLFGSRTDHWCGQSTHWCLTWWLCVMFLLRAWMRGDQMSILQEGDYSRRSCYRQQILPWGGWWWWASPEESSSILLSSADSTPRHQEGLLRLCCMDREKFALWEDLARSWFLARYFEESKPVLPVWHSPRVDS